MPIRVRWASMLVAITGPAGAGKTTTAQTLVKEFAKGVHIDMDTVKHFVCTGFRYDETTEGLKQWTLLGENISALTSNFLRQDYVVVINGCVHELTWREIEKYNVFDHKVLLFPDEHTNLSRDLQRPKAIAMGRSAVLSHRNLFLNDAFYSDWLEYDSSGDSIDESVQALLKLIMPQLL